MEPAETFSILDFGATANDQTDDTTAIEKALSFRRYLDQHHCTQEDLGRRLKIDRSTIANLMRLLELPEKVQTEIQKGQISMGHARALLPLPALDQERLARVVASKGLSVRATEALVRDRGKPAKARPAPVKDADTARLERELSDRIGAPVAILQSGSGGGKLSISYSNLDELEGILSHLK